MIVEDASGGVLALEVKLSATVEDRDVRHLSWLRAQLGEQVRDAAIIAALQRLEHDEIAGYGCARTWASLLGYTTAASELLKTLTEERRFDEGLTRVAETLNKSALEPVAMAR